MVTTVNGTAPRNADKDSRSLPDGMIPALQETLAPGVGDASPLEMSIPDPACIDVKHIATIPPRELTAREFCRRMYGLTGLPEATILEVEIDPDYRKRCIGLLSRVLDLHSQTIRNWGATRYFPNMPPHYRRVLGLYWERGELIVENRRLRRFNA
ncbi:hypothetical protein V0288_11510 [Pannus brasiliensis CCIBt3594]|uniref:Uncharacterized protein n=1 Tax=Pannus brasiliensis CCIBt3594 TaxID=1427578 RepID=A0AAW9QIW6_9CHRO